MSLKLEPPCGYAGGKRKFAAAIVDRLLAHKPERVFDIGCGSGPVTLELLTRGVPASSITMVDAGPWGEFWSAVGAGTLDLGRLKSFFKRVQELPAPEVAQYVEQEVAALPPSPETFLVLQAAAFGSTPVWWDGQAWRRGEMNIQRKYKARSYWEPGPGSTEKSPRGTIFTPGKIVARVERVMEAGKGLKVVHGEAEEVELFHPGVAYIDPPYAGFSGYGVVMDVDLIVTNALVPVYVSEGRKMAGCDEAWRLSGGRKGAALNGKSENQVAEEWLNFFDKTDYFQCIDPTCPEADEFHHHEGSRGSGI